MRSPVLSRSTTDTDIAHGQQRRGFWLRTLHNWHWISSAVSLIGMLLFALSGITLNHAARIEAEPQTVQRTATLPPALLKALGTRADGEAPLPEAAADWLDAKLGIALRGRNAEWSEEELYLSLPVVFCVTGLFLLQMHARQRRMTWPYVGLGLVVPVLIALLFIH